MPHSSKVPERHFVTRVGWLRAAVLGANDGLLSTSSLIVGVAAASVPQQQLAITAVAGLVAGAMSMAAGEFVSVSSQADAERADVARETSELANDPVSELHELEAIYRRRGLDGALAKQVATALMEHDALDAHLRDELGIAERTSARPVQAALASAASFAAGALAPLVATMTIPKDFLAASIFGVSLVALAILGAAGARLGGAPVARAVIRVVLWGSLAMIATAAIGRLFHVPV